MGFDRDGLPLSLQIVGPEWTEGRILAIAGAYEDAAPRAPERLAPLRRAMSFEEVVDPFLTEGAMRRRHLADGRTAAVTTIHPRLIGKV